MKLSIFLQKTSFHRRNKRDHHKISGTGNAQEPNRHPVHPASDLLLSEHGQGVGRRGGRQYPDKLSTLLLALGVPKMAQLILPLSLFLGLLMTLGRLYTESEITVMHACGLGKRTLIIAAMIRRCSPLRSRR